MPRFRFSQNLILILVLDTLLIAGAFWAAHLVRFDFAVPPVHRGFFLRFVPLVLAAKLSSFALFDLYGGMWRYTSLRDVSNIVKGTTAGSLGALLLIFFLGFRTGYSRSVFVIDWCFTILSISALRLSVRVYYDALDRGLPLKDLPRSAWRVLPRSAGQLFRRPAATGRRLIIAGAGNAGELIYRELHTNPRLAYHVTGFVDDDPAKLHKKIHGIPVMGTLADLPALVPQLSADEVLIAIPSASAAQMRRIVERCTAAGIPFKTVPGLGELIEGRQPLEAIREVSYRDLLGRDPVRLDETRIGTTLEGQTVLVTGAGGSIGSELCRQIARFAPRAIVLVERAESPLYDIELELRQRFPGVEVAPLLADVCSLSHLAYAFKAHRPQVVFHAAAYKHVPMLEREPWRAVENNIRGTQNIVALSGEHAVQRFVFVSTDKAVRPANVMGATKRVAEMLVHGTGACATTTTRFMVVRFGNVVGSVGSVIPLFQRQIRAGGPVTVTHPDITRYFMTISEAAQLILQAGAMGQGGEIFILEMGAPIKIVDLARDLIRLSGFTPGTDIPIRYIGLRPGEKLYEELMTADENLIPTEHRKIMVLRGTECRLEQLNGDIADLVDLTRTRDAGRIRTCLARMVPDYDLPSDRNA